MGVDFANFRTLVGKLFMSHSKDAIRCRVLKVSRLQNSFSVSPSVGIWDPDALLGIVWLGQVRTLHFDGRQLELCRVGVSGSLHQLDVARHVGVECVLVLVTLWLVSKHHMSSLVDSVVGHARSPWKSLAT